LSDRQARTRDGHHINVDIGWARYDYAQFRAWKALTFITEARQRGLLDQANLLVGFIPCKIDELFTRLSTRRRFWGRSWRAKFQRNYCALEAKGVAVEPDGVRLLKKRP
jgi:hypothetical protein